MRIDDSADFVAQHYRDFLSREPDATGLNFWAGGIESCGGDARCREVKRINVSAAFFLSIESQETGYLVYRLRKAADGSAPTYAEFVAQSAELAAGVVVGREGWRDVLESNKREFVQRWAQTPDFRARYDSLTDEQYVDVLFTNAGAGLPAEFQDSLVAALRAGTETRTTVLRQVAEHEALKRAEFNPAFVLMQYFGYLRRDPDASGYQFWLMKLEQFGGNYIEAEMVRAFLSSDEYRNRFGL